MWKLKTDSHLPKIICFTCFDESPLKIMKNAFYFILKALFSLKLFRFLSWILGHIKENGLIRNIRLISEFMTSQTGQQTIAIHILLSISRSKGNQTMKPGQLIEYNKIIIVLQKSCRKWGRETSSRPLFVFLKKHYMTPKQVVCSLVSISLLDSFQLGME